MTAYDTDNLFAKILRGDIPCHKIYEDADTLAFMDIMPQAEGHCLVLPKTASRNLLDADPKIFSSLMSAVQKIARAAQKAFKSDGILIMQFNEPAAGQTVFHLHVHVIPRKEGVALKSHARETADHAALAKQAEMIRAEL
jgi:histidine triad (HIT) family protein